MGQGAWCLTVRVSEPALAHYGAMPHAPCDKMLHGAQYERYNIFNIQPQFTSSTRRFQPSGQLCNRGQYLVGELTVRFPGIGGKFAGLHRNGI